MTDRAGRIDTFAYDNLPPRDQWPVLDLSHPAYQYPERLNCVTAFVDRWIEEGKGDRRAIVTPRGTWTYADLHARVNRLARVLVEDMGLIPGNRVLLRAANNPMMVAAYLAVIKAGGIAVGTMPLLRSRELLQILDKAEISHALCDRRLAAELDQARAQSRTLREIGYFDASGEDEIERAMAGKPDSFDPYPSRADEICLIAFTSGTTGRPKGTMHFHRDMLVICDSFSRHDLKPTADDLFCGTPPIAFTFGLGGLALFPFRVGAATLLIESSRPKDLLAAIEAHRATICFSAPTAYRAMLGMLGQHDISSLRRCVSAGEHLPRPTYDAFLEATGIKLIDGIGGTEMLHIYISAADDAIRPGATGRPLPGYRAKIIDDDGNDLGPGRIGRLAVQGPTGCRYLADDRQTAYVQNGWNLPGDAFSMDEDGYFWYAARTDDMIVSAGYNIAGPEVETALLEHPAVAECAVIGKPDPERGQIVKAFVVPADPSSASEALAKALQDHVKATIAPYKYPREIEFMDALPKTETGKLQRFKLKEREMARA